MSPFVLYGGNNVIQVLKFHCFNENVAVLFFNNVVTAFHKNKRHLKRIVNIHKQDALLLLSTVFTKQIFMFLWKQQPSKNSKRLAFLFLTDQVWKILSNRVRDYVVCFRSSTRACSSKLALKYRLHLLTRLRDYMSSSQINKPLKQ